jgi:SAM-dependent methyltransferase
MLLGGKDDNMEKSSDLRERATKLWKAGRKEAAMHELWAAYRLDRTDIDTKAALTNLITHYPSLLDPRLCPWNLDADMKSDLVRLLQDRDVDPSFVVYPGWSLLIGDPSWVKAKKEGRYETLAAELETDELALALLRAEVVQLNEAERDLTKVRRWLLVSGQWRCHPRLVEALRIQATLNGGAWPFDEEERARLQEADGLPIVATYLLPERSEVAQESARTVAGEYERWPYPVWQRVMARKGCPFPDKIRAIDPGGPNCIPVDAKVLIAGCGTGREAVCFALDHPDTLITAIDVSEASLRFARERCAALGIRSIQFKKLDLHRVAELNEEFDAITSCGVLHHLPDPERGWEALVSVLRPDGVMKIMVYSKLGYRNIRDEPGLVADLASGPMSDDAVRHVRQRLMNQAERSKVARSITRAWDFATLAGTRDLVLHTEVHLFDMPRISHALDSLGLRLLSFEFGWPDSKWRYDAMFPHDPMHRDLESLAKFEEIEPKTFAGMYGFWCRKVSNGPLA